LFKTIDQYIGNIRHRGFRIIKQSYFDKISEKINTESNGSYNWWNLVKSLLHGDSGGDRSIPPLQVENDMIQDDNKKAELFNESF
jgi:hypothetical protein